MSPAEASSSTTKADGLGVRNWEWWRRAEAGSMIKPGVTRCQLRALHIVCFFSHPLVIFVLVDRWSVGCSLSKQRSRVLEQTFTNNKPQLLFVFSSDFTESCTSLPHRKVGKNSTQKECRLLSCRRPSMSAPDESALAWFGHAVCSRCVAFAVYRCGFMPEGSE